MIRARIAIAAALLFAATASFAPARAQDQAQDKPAPAADQEPAAPKLVARELVVLHVDRYGTRANDPQLLRTTLTTPIKHRGRIKLQEDDGRYANTPMPLGLISFEGRIDKPLRVRVEMPDPNALLHAHWPLDAITSVRHVDWPEVDEAGDKQRAVQIGDGGHWLDPLRKSKDRLWLRGRDSLQGQEAFTKERFLLYDASMPFQPKLGLQQSETGYTLNTRAPDSTPPITLLLHRLDKGWSTQEIAGPWPKKVTQLPGKPDANTPGQDIDTALKPIAQLLADRGYSTAETELALGMISAADAERSTMSLVYVLPDGEIDTHIKLRITPEPARVIRTAIVVLTNVDPDLASQVERLIAQLKSDEWQTRDKAQRELVDMGKAAVKQVQALRNSPDPEVAFRAELILEAYAQKYGSGASRAVPTHDHVVRPTIRGR